MKALFYAPMKSPNHPNASGDRQMARQLMGLIGGLGYQVEIASELRSWQSEPDPTQFADNQRQAHESIKRLARSKAELFVTYRVYHKAPDLIGPAVSKALNIPYVIIEASHAERRRSGEWADQFQLAEKAIRFAHAVVAMHEVDRKGLAPIVPPDRLHMLSPFLDTERFSHRVLRQERSSKVKLITVAMMRSGDKARSFEILAEALEDLKDLNWSLTVIGDGPERDRLSALFDQDRTEFLGFLTPEKLVQTLFSHDLFVWPAWREAYGMAILEAQAAGLPVIAGDAGGVPDIVSQDATGLLTPVGDVEAFREAIRALSQAPETWPAMRDAARENIKRRHSLAAAKDKLGQILESAKANCP